MSGAAITEADCVLELVQLTDSHLFADAQGKLLGLETCHSLARVVERVLAERPRVDLLLATGDLSQDGSPDSYRHFRRHTDPIDAPKRWCPGNHDEREAMYQVAAGTELMSPVIDLGGWRVVMLDSLVPGAVFGQLAASQLALLETALAEAPQRHTLVCLHHHPVSIGSRWMDGIGLREPEALFAVLARHAQVRALLWGHIHQSFDQTRGDLRLLASPSTSVQFEPGSEDFQIASHSPGYRWLRLHPDGRIDTGVSRVEGLVFQVEDGVKGY